MRIERVTTAILMLSSFVGLGAAIICGFYGIPMPSWFVAIVAFAALGQGAGARMALQQTDLH